MSEHLELTILRCEEFANLVGVRALFGDGWLPFSWITCLAPGVLVMWWRSTPWQQKSPCEHFQDHPDAVSLLLPALGATSVDEVHRPQLMRSSTQAFNPIRVGNLENGSNGSCLETRAGRH